MANGSRAKRYALLAGAVTVVVLISGYLWLAGSAVVVDETGGVETAFIVTTDGREQPLYRLRRGYFYTVPTLEGTIEVRCGSGEKKRSGYVTGHLDTKIRVVGDTPCARLVYDFE